MINVKNMRAITILSLAMVGFGMQRFNPFQAEPYDNSSSWGASLNQNRKMTPMPKQQDSDTEPAEETWNDKQQSDEQQNLTSDTASDPAADKAIFY